MTLLAVLFAGRGTGWHRGLLDVPVSIGIMVVALAVIGVALVVIWRR